MGMYCLGDRERLRIKGCRGALAKRNAPMDSGAIRDAIAPYVL